MNDKPRISLAPSLMDTSFTAWLALMEVEHPDGLPPELLGPKVQERRWKEWKLERETKHEKYNPGPDPDDTSIDAFRSEKECQYQIMPPWWYDPAAQQAMYEKWLERKIAEKADRRAAIAGGERVMDELEKV